MSDIYPAHMNNNIIQSVSNHCRNTAKYAKSVCESIDLGNTAYFVGLIHDMGKYTDKFKKYIEEASMGKDVKRGSVNHTFAAVQYILKKHTDNCSGKFEDLVNELLAYATGAHHGLFDIVNEFGESGFEHRVSTEDNEYEQAKNNFFKYCTTENEIGELYNKSASELKVVINKLIELSNNNQEEFLFYLSMLARFLLSAVIEGDRRDTAEFMGEEHVEIMRDWGIYSQKVDEKIKEFDASSPINVARHKISEICRAEAKNESAIYRLNVPTGGGKTLSTLRYSLAHANMYDKKQIIFVSPLLSILDQNARVIRDYIDNDSIVLEHHSNVVKSEDGEDSILHDILCASWNAPIVITTLVQFLNTLFDGKTRAIRRMSALSNSIIIIDEVQTVPQNMITLFNLAMNFLNKICKTTIVLCSATQPALQAVKHPISNIIREMVPYDEKIWQPFWRTKITDRGFKNLEEIAAMAADMLNEADSLLIICNKRNEAKFLYEEIHGSGIEKFHLSASMFMKHRLDTIEQIKLSLQNKNIKTVCVSTQVIEAGVDISFENVIRLTAGMDSIIQSAGRCNRNGERMGLSDVSVVTCIDESLSMLKDIKKGKEATIMLFEEIKNNPGKFKESLFSEESVDYYYKNYYQLYSQGYQDYTISTGGNHYSIFSWLSDNEVFANINSPEIKKYLLRAAPKTAGRYFEVFDNATKDVIVECEGSIPIINDLKRKENSYDIECVKKLLKKANNYTISLYEYMWEKLEKSGALEHILDNTVTILRSEFYDDATGLSNEIKEEAFII